MLLDDSLRGVELVARFDGAGRRRRLRRRRAGHPARASRCRTARSCCSRRSGASATFLERWAPPNARVVWGRAEEQETDWAGVAVAKALAQPPTAAEWCLPLVREGGAVVLWVGPSADRERVARVAERLAGELVECAATGSSCSARSGPTPAGLPAPRRRGEEAPAGVAPARAGSVRVAARSWAVPAGSTRSRTRRAASARRRPRSTSPPASPRRASARSSSTSTRRRTRPPGSGCARTARRRYDLLDGAPLARAREADAVRRTSSSSRRGRSSPAPRSSSRSATTATATSPRRSQHAEGFDFVLLDCPPSLGPLTVNALAAADRVIVPVQTEYYALEGLAQLVQSINLIKTRLNPRLAIAGVLLTMVDGRTRLSADVEARGAQALRRRSSSTPSCRAPCASRRRRATAFP